MHPADQKRCACCRRVLPLDKFYACRSHGDPNTAKGRHSYCKPCFRDYMKTRYYARRGEEVAA